MNYFKWLESTVIDYPSLVSVIKLLAVVLVLLFWDDYVYYEINKMRDDDDFAEHKEIWYG